MLLWLENVVSQDGEVTAYAMLDICEMFSRGNVLPPGPRQTAVLERGKKITSWKRVF